jgi:hypothetical protein
MITGAADYNQTAVAGGWPSICDATNSYSHPDLLRMLDLWMSLAADGIPSRRLMSPRLLKRHLRDIGLFEQVRGDSGERRYRVRFSGTAFSQILGDFTGRFLDESIGQHYLERWNASLDLTLSAGVPLRFIARSDTSNMSFLTGEYFSAPLRDDSGKTTLVMTAGRFSSRLPWSEVEAQTRKALGLG